MKDLMRFAAFCLVIVFVLAVSVLPGQAQDSRKSLGVYGCFVASDSLVSTTDNRIVFAGCEGPKGVFYSRDAGKTWTFAAGGLYTAGEGRRVVLTSQYALMYDDLNDENVVLRTALPESSTASWQPNWESVTTLKGYKVYPLYGDYVLLMPAEPMDPLQIKVYDAGSDTITSGVDYPTEEPEMHPGGDGSWVYIVKGLWAAPGDDSTRNVYLYKASFDKNTGQLGTWQGPVNLSAASGLPANSQIQNMMISTNNEIYLSVEGSDQCNLPLYVSIDGGSSFTRAKIPSDGQEECNPFRGGSFSGNNYLIESALSTDGGTSWTEVLQTRASTLDQSISMDPSQVLLDPKSADWALMKSNIGLDRVSGITSGTPSWERAYSGFEAIEIYDLRQSDANKNRVVLSNRAGYSFTNNFLDETPTWVHPYCPNGDCYGGRGAAIDQVNPDIAYLGGNPWIYKVTMDYSGATPSFQAEQFIQKPNDQLFFGELLTTTVLPNTLIACYQAVQGTKDGGIYFYNSSNGTEIKHALEGVPLNKFVAVTDQIMFVSVGAANDNFPEATYRGIYRSVDGGSSWTKSTDENFTGLTLVNSFAYDSKNDILYAATWDGGSENTAVLRLENAAASNETWEKAPGSSPFPLSAGETFRGGLGMTAVSVNSETGEVSAAGADRLANSEVRIWTSIDQGQTWSLRYTGLRAETIHVLNYSSSENASGQSLNPAESVWERLIQAASSGLYALAEESDGTVSCKLKVSKKCRRKVAKGTRCKLTVNLKDATTKTGQSGAFRLYQKMPKADVWNTLGKSLNTRKKGKKTKVIKVKKTKQYRVRFSSVYCNTNSKAIKVKKKNR